MDKLNVINREAETIKIVKKVAKSKKEVKPKVEPKVEPVSPMGPLLDNHVHNPKKVASKWVEHVKTEAKKMNLTYGNALKNAEVKASYKKVSFNK